MVSREQPRFDYMHIMRTMDIMEEHYDEYITHLFEKSRDIIKRDTSVCFYDCSNYYFETETEDDDYVDEVTGETVRGLRKYGPSKEHRPNPVVEMGLFMDRDYHPYPAVFQYFFLINPQVESFVSRQDFVSPVVI